MQKATVVTTVKQPRFQARRQMTAKVSPVTKVVCVSAKASVENQQNTLVLPDIIQWQPLFPKCQRE